MIVRCPICSTSYQVDPRALGPNGRMVRCAQCSHTWHQAPPAEALAAAGAPAGAAAEGAAEPPPPPPFRAVEAPEPEPPRLRGVLADAEDAGAHLPEEPPNRGYGATIGWVLLLVVIGGLVAAAIWQRDEVIAQWPASARVYQLLGLVKTHPGDGLVLKTSVRRDDQNGVPRLVIEGEVINSAPVALAVPKLKVELKDAAQRVVQTWTFSASTDRLLPGASVPFTTSVERPNESASEVRVSLLDEGG